MTCSAAHRSKVTRIGECLLFALLLFLAMLPHGSDAGRKPLQPLRSGSDSANRPGGERLTAKRAREGDVPLHTVSSCGILDSGDKRKCAGVADEPASHDHAPSARRRANAFGIGEPACGVARLHDDAASQEALDSKGLDLTAEEGDGAPGSGLDDAGVLEAGWRCGQPPPHARTRATRAHARDTRCGIDRPPPRRRQVLHLP